mmetsp:Transcript_14668/g.28212  ORF Transcript_14668/g.28212 Transcript_14668/m.28212 type:complete len:246 (+) Transcript_14668:323-1060(+)
MYFVLDYLACGVLHGVADGDGEGVVHDLPNSGGGGARGHLLQLQEVAPHELLVAAVAVALANLGEHAVRGVHVAGRLVQSDDVQAAHHPEHFAGGVGDGQAGDALLHQHLDGFLDGGVGADAERGGGHVLRHLEAVELGGGAGDARRGVALRLLTVLKVQSLSAEGKGLLGDFLGRLAVRLCDKRPRTLQFAHATKHSRAHEISAHGRHFDTRDAFQVQMLGNGRERTLIFFQCRSAGLFLEALR